MVNESLPGSPYRRGRRTKRRHKNHETGERGINIVKRHLPTNWIAREVSPDYGIDLNIEVFEPALDSKDAADTRGEHLYAQVKAVTSVREVTVQATERFNPVTHDSQVTMPGAERVSIETIAFSIETEELVTVEAMGAAVPVLLLVVDLSTETVYYVCLNDFISRVILPARPDFASQDSITIHVPRRNVLDPNVADFDYITLLARRPKLYSAFVEIAHTNGANCSKVYRESNLTSRRQILNA